MRKRLSCVFLALMLMFVSMAPAYAAEVTPAGDVGEMLEMSDAEMAEFSADNSDSVTMAAENGNSDMLLSTRAALVHGAVYSMTVYPVAFVEGHDNYVYFSSIKRTFQYTTYYQNAGVSLAAGATQQLLTLLDSALTKNGAPYKLAGWRLEVIFLFEAPSPQSFAWTGTGTNLPSTPTTTVSLRNHGISVKAKIPCGFSFPSGINLTSEPYNIKIGGLYTFKTDEGNTLSMNVSGTFTLNSNLANSGGYWAV